MTFHLWGFTPEARIQLITGCRWLSIKEAIITHIKMSGLIRTEAKNNIFCWHSVKTIKGIPLKIYSTNTKDRNRKWRKRNSSSQCPWRKQHKLLEKNMKQFLFHTQLQIAKLLRHSQKQRHGILTYQLPESTINLQLPLNTSHKDM